jgi:hypothetical protein
VPNELLFVASRAPDGTKGNTMTLQCLFCDQGNPGGAKFCNDCGTPLHFKPCPQCDGINGRFAEACYRCGAAFSSRAGEGDAAELSSQPDAGSAVASPIASWNVLRGDVPQNAAASNDAAPAPTIPLPGVPDRMPWIPMATAVLAACGVLAVVAWQADRSVTASASTDVASRQPMLSAVRSVGPGSTSLASGASVQPRESAVVSPLTPPEERIAAAPGAADRSGTPPAAAAAAPPVVPVAAGQPTRSARAAAGKSYRSASASRGRATVRHAAQPASARARPTSKADETPPADIRRPESPSGPRVVPVMLATRDGTATRVAVATSRQNTGTSPTYACAETAAPTAACDIRLVAKGN